MDNLDNEFFSMKNQRRSNMANKKKFGKKYKAGNDNTGNKRSNDLVDVYFDTREYFNSKKQTVKKGILYDINKLGEIPALPEYNTVYTVKNQDTLDMALDFIKEGYKKPLVLNMASDYKAGGGVASGKTAQEECLFRRTNAFQTYSDDWYPLEENAVIYSPEVQIIKDSNHQMLEQSVIDQGFISMIGVAALRKPKLNYGTYYDEDRELMSRKIESIFKIALEQGNDTLVLGALGCGVFRNPPEEVANIYKIYTNLYGKYFKKIGFAILCVKDSDKENLDMFMKKY